MIDKINMTLNKRQSHSVPGGNDDIKSLI